MWFKDASADDRWHDAMVHLRKDATLRKIIDRVGPCMLRPTLSRDYYIRLVQSILSQQVSVKAADAMYRKLSAHFPRQRPTPERIVEFLTTSDEEIIRSCGLSRQKRAYLHDLAERFASKRIDPKRFAKMDDELLIAHLTEVKGIGQWTVEMLLIFALNRPDVWPMDDLGIRESLYRHWPRRFDVRPTPGQVKDFADKWRPWRTVASWYLWRGLSLRQADEKAKKLPPALPRAKR